MYSCVSWSIFRIMALMDGSHCTRTPVAVVRLWVRDEGVFFGGGEGIGEFTFDGFGHDGGFGLGGWVGWDGGSYLWR